MSCFGVEKTSFGGGTELRAVGERARAGGLSVDLQEDTVPQISQIAKDKINLRDDITLGTSTSTRTPPGNGAGKYFNTLIPLLVALHLFFPLKALDSGEIV